MDYTILNMRKRSFRMHIHAGDSISGLIQKASVQSAQNVTAGMVPRDLD